MPIGSNKSVRAIATRNHIERSNIEYARAVESEALNSAGNGIPIRQRDPVSYSRRTAPIHLTVADAQSQVIAVALKHDILNKNAGRELDHVTGSARIRIAAR